MCAEQNMWRVIVLLKCNYSSREQEQGYAVTRAVHFEYNNDIKWDGGMQSL